MKKIRFMISLVLTVVVVLFIYGQLKLYKDIERKMANETLTFNDLFYNTSVAKLHEIETVLDLIGAQLIFEDIYKDAEKTGKLLRFMRARIKDSLGIAFIEPNGDYLTIGSDIDITKTKNLHKLEATRESFELTLNSEKMILGRVYFFEASQEWILPLRKAIRDADGNVIGVISTALILDDSTGFINDTKLYPKQVSMLVNGRGNYRVYVTPLEKNKYEEFYSHPISQKAIDKVSFAGDADINLLTSYRNSILYNVDSDIDLKQILGAIRYSEYYDLWIVSSRSRDYAKDEFLKGGLILRASIFAIVVIVVVILFVIIVEKEEEIKRNLNFKAKHDFLTGLYNRNILDELADKWMKPNAAPFILIFIDLDNFKNINDAFGHSCGDVILTQVADRLRELFPRGAELVRHGGDEFAILVKSENLTSMNLTGVSIVKKLSESYYVSGMKLHIGVSVGISSFPHDGMTMEQLMISADLAMYKAKKTKNSYAIYDKELKDIIRKKINIEHELRHALQSGDELYMVYQPQIDKIGIVHGCEALVRWDSRRLGFIPPNEFVSVAEESGLMEALGSFILEKSCSEFSEVMKKCGDRCLKQNLSINISVKQILEKNFKDKLLETIRKYNISPSQVTIEITESLFIDNLEYILPLLYDIRKTKVMISLDDFGTGYSSLSMLRTLPIDELKIDKSFIDNICNNEQDSKMVNSIIDMGHNMNMHVLSEGVEEKSQLKMLATFGCDYYQGYHFSKPLRMEEFMEFVKEFNSN